MGSDVEFVAALIMNKSKYFYNCEDKNFKSISAWSKICGLISEDEFVQNKLRNLVETAMKKLHKLEFVKVDINFMKCMNNEHSSITQIEFNEYKEKSNSCFKKSVGDEISSRYRVIINLKKCISDMINTY